MKESTFSSLNEDAADRVPPPRRNPWLRLGLPCLILVGAASLMLLTGWDAWQPRREVAAIPVGVRTVEVDAEESTRGPGGVAVQAPGWVEADPFDIYVSALTDGVIEEILVLEGDRVVAGQEIARLHDEEAVIEVARLEAQAKEHQAHLEKAKAVRGRRPVAFASIGAASHHAVDASPRDHTPYEHRPAPTSRKKFLKGKTS